MLRRKCDLVSRKALTTRKIDGEFWKGDISMSKFVERFQLIHPTKLMGKLWEDDIFMSKFVDKILNVRLTNVTLTNVSVTLVTR